MKAKTIALISIIAGTAIAFSSAMPITPGRCGFSGCYKKVFVCGSAWHS